MTITEHELAIFHASLNRASANGSFLDAFYDGFTSSSIDIENIFKDSDMDRLKRKLQSSLHMMTMLADDIAGTEMYMGHLAKVHDRYHIPPEFFDIWLDVLIDATREFDEEFDEQTETVCRKVIGKGIEIMSVGNTARIVDT